MHSIKICRSKIAASTVWLSLPKFHYACKWDSAFSCGLWVVPTKWACHQSLVKNKMSLCLPCTTLVCILPIDFPIWNMPNAKFSQVSVELHKGHSVHGDPSKPQKASQSPPSLFCCRLSHGSMGPGRLLSLQDLICLMWKTSAPSFLARAKLLLVLPLSLVG